MDIVSFPVRNSSFCSEDKKKGEIVEMNLIDDMISQNELYKTRTVQQMLVLAFVWL